MRRSVGRTILLSLCLMGQTVYSSGQSGPAASVGSGHETDPPPTFEAVSERPISWKVLPQNFLQDQKTVWSFPLRTARGEDWIPALGIVATTAALVALDPHDTPYFRRTENFDNFNRVLSGRNTILGMTIVPASAYAAGLVRKDTYAQHTALLAGEAVADAEVLTLVMKDIDRRLRPSDISPHGNFGDTWFDARASVLGKRASFPSGHTIEAFSIATIFAERYHKHRWVPWVSYGLASLVGFSRISLQAHFPSDVFAGAALGYFIGHGVVLRTR